MSALHCVSCRSLLRLRRNPPPKIVTGGDDDSLRSLTPPNTLDKPVSLVQQFLSFLNLQKMPQIFSQLPLSRNNSLCALAIFLSNFNDVELCLFSFVPEETPTPFCERGVVKKRSVSLFCPSSDLMIPLFTFFFSYSVSVLAPVLI